MYERVQNIKPELRMDVSSELTRALYRLPESCTPEMLEKAVKEISKKAKVPDVLRNTLHLKLARHLTNVKGAALNIPTLVDALKESMHFLDTTRGSINKLYELHAVKTAEKLAIIRKKEAAAKNRKKFNPYEILFETRSGKFYFARLLNMAHLKEESRLMDHCVGTSGSYFRKVKRGTAEILSLRSTKTHVPEMTVEYNPKTGKLVQIQHQSRVTGEPMGYGEYGDTVLEALCTLPLTVRLDGTKRKLNEQHLKHPVKIFGIRDRHECGSLSTDDLRFLYDIDSKDNQGNWVTRAIKTHVKIERNFMDDMEALFGSVATSPDEITAETRCYIGPLPKPLTKEFVDATRSIEHVYRNMPASFQQMFSIAPGKNVVMCSVDDLFNDNREHTLKEVQAAGAQVGLTSCPQSAIPKLRNKYINFGVPKLTAYVSTKPFFINSHAAQFALRYDIHDEDYCVPRYVAESREVGTKYQPQDYFIFMCAIPK